ncbi:hypothetical protein NYR55_03035 [Sphingomonas sp. BGYR3]|uniref:hypothetical protein n=1 Tax=Sphingomonas sp. BGYR3 TaxID=2975483 RepID=UPI0021A2F3EA|nr:hypothetical protein [Sphingomonas sp. BGYR3]MDG5487599.1 hypothetical protein [Sphingomonas sp. BGYR3]
MLELLSFFALFVALVLCVVRTYVELRSRRFWWASAAFVGALGILTAPFPKQVVTITLPSN